MPFNPKVGRPLRHTIAVFSAMLLASAALLAGSAPTAAHAADGTNGISGSPYDGTTQTRTRFDYQVDPGQHLDDKYLVRNTGTTTQVMKVFATDAFDTPIGQFSLLDTKAVPTDAGSWVTFANGKPSIQIPLAAGKSQLVSFRLMVPANASPGDHAGGIVISVATPQGNIVVDRRVATRLYVRVKGDLTAALTVSGLVATYKGRLNPFDGATDVTFTIRNNGNVALGAAAVASVRTFFGIGASGLKRFEVDELLPGSSRVVTITVPGVPQLGYLSAHISLVPTIDPGALNPGPLREVSRDSVFIEMPWWLLVILIVVIGVLVFVLLRRRLDRRRAAAWVTWTEAEARREAVEGIDRIGEQPVLVGSSAGGTDLDGANSGSQ